MEMVLEATSDLTSACTGCHSPVCSCRNPQTDLVSDPMATEVQITSEVRADFRSEATIIVGGDKPPVSDPASAFSEAPMSRISGPQLFSEQFVNDLCSKEPYCNP